MSPHGIAVACTDGNDDQWLVGITGEGETFPFGFNLLIARANYDGAIRMTHKAIRRLRSDALVMGEPWRWLVRIHAHRGDRVELARALLMTGLRTHGEVPGLWTEPGLAVVPGEHMEAIRRRVGPAARPYYDGMYHGKGVPPVLLRALGISPQLDGLRTRALQAYGALCLAHFCAAKDPEVQLC